MIEFDDFHYSFMHRKAKITTSSQTNNFSTLKFASTRISYLVAVSL